MKNSPERDLSQLIHFLTEQNIEFSTPSINSTYLKKYNQCCYAESYYSELAILPADISEIIAVVVFLDGLSDGISKLKLYTISTGQNWGYGSGTPSSQAAVLMSLHKLNNEPKWVGNRHDKKEPYGKTLGIVRIEPGVTQQQLYDFLQQEGGQFWMDATGSSVNSSVLANTLERGFGHTPYGDHFDHVAGLEVVMADGTFVKTGHAGHENSANVGVHKHGHGPVIEGIMSQSNLGIVTAMYLHVMPAKQYLKKFFIKLSSQEDFFEAVEVLRPLKMSGTLQSQMHCGNAHKGIQAMMRYPFKEAKGETPLPDWLFQRICKKHDISPWTISGAVYSDSKTSLNAKMKKVNKALSKVDASVMTLTPSFANFLQWFVNLPIWKWLKLERITNLINPFEILQHLIYLKQGKPTNFFIQSVYYRMRDLAMKITGNPDADNVGLMWLAPIGPMTRETLEIMIETASSISKEHGFDPALSITLLNEKAVDCVISIIFDRTEPEEDQKALKCYDKMLKTFNQQGFSSYRSSIRSMQTAQLGFSSELLATHQKLKQGLDPKDIFASGHYIAPL